MLVIDASVVVKALTEEIGSDLATDRLALEPHRVAPDWLSVEIASALSKKVRHAGLPPAIAEKYLAALPMIIPDLAPTLPLLPAALRLSIGLRHAVYDCLYLALAIDRDCALLTADRKFFDTVASCEHGQRMELLA